MFINDQINAAEIIRAAGIDFFIGYANWRIEWKRAGDVHTDFRFDSYKVYCNC